MIPLALALVGGYLIGDSMKKKQVFAEGGGVGGGLPSQRMMVRTKVALAIGMDKAFKYLKKEYVVSPFELLEGAVRKQFITVDEIDSNLWDSAVEEAEDIDSDYRDSGEGIGSSDMNAFIASMLNGAGIKIGNVNNRYVRMSDGGVMAKGGRGVMAGEV